MANIAEGFHSSGRDFMKFLDYSLFFSRDPELLYRPRSSLNSASDLERWQPGADFGRPQDQRPNCISG